MSFNILTDSPPPSTKTVLYTKPTFPKFVSALQSIPNSFTKTHFNFSSPKPTAHSISAAGFVPRAVSDLETERHRGSSRTEGDDRCSKCHRDDAFAFAMASTFVFCKKPKKVHCLVVINIDSDCLIPSLPLDLLSNFSSSAFCTNRYRNLDRILLNNGFENNTKLEEGHNVFKSDRFDMFNPNALTTRRDNFNASQLMGILFVTIFLGSNPISYVVSHWEDEMLCHKD
ncbi:hypothetical protein DKX38_029733 [Salix brachista]|uniref:Uncharacterized protein n=1 Tax=Salix brachista TaxID=2182728 RepID=A0A5N5J4S0_9ROSI|nr:hypothetical protein DKX38_029733 [Salix brachista]